MEDDDDLGVRTFRCFSDSVLTRPTFKIHGEIRPDVPKDASLETVGLTTLVDFIPHSDKLPKGSEIHQQILHELTKRPETESNSQRPEHMVEVSQKKRDVLPNTNPRRRAVSYSETTKAMVPKPHRSHPVYQKILSSHKIVPVKSSKQDCCKKSQDREANSQSLPKWNNFFNKDSSDNLHY